MYTTTNELKNFDFSEAQIADVEILTDAFHLCLDNVRILPDNSANRDIRLMRTNGLILRLTGMKIDRLIREGYKYYNADGKLMREDADEELACDANTLLEVMPEGYVISLKRTDNQYELCFDGNDESTYDLTLLAEGETEEWEKFFNL